jgi:hypothetical protein
MPSAALDRLSTALDRMHLYLATGNLEGLAGAAEALEAELASLQPSDMPALEALRPKAARNARCLEAAARGVRDARRRLAEIRAIGAGLGTYDVNGQRDATPLHPTRLTQRL